MIHEISTTSSLTYNFFPLKYGLLKFRVKAKNDAHIALTTGPSEDHPIYEIFIGGWANTKSGFRHNQNKTETIIVDTPETLIGDKTQEFWIKWSDGVIMVGHGINSHPFLTYCDHDPFPIGYYGVRTGNGSTGEWLVEGGRSISTPNELKYQFFPIPSGALAIDVRCPSNAHIALISSRQPEKYEESPRIEIILGGWENTLSVIRRDGVSLPRVSTATPGIVTESEFRCFRIQWKNGLLLVLHGDYDPEPILEYHDPDQVAITHYGVRTSYGASGDWKINEGEDPPFDDDTGTGNYKWKVASNIPPDAFIGGNNSEGFQFVGRTYCKGGLLPGKVNPNRKLCYVSYEGKLETSHHFQILCGTDMEWIPTNGSHIPSDAVIGGHTKNDETLYIGRVHHEGTLSVGKIQRSKGLCYICHHGNELTFRNYEILVSKVH